MCFQNTLDLNLSLAWKNICATPETPPVTLKIITF